MIKARAFIVSAASSMDILPFAFRVSFASVKLASARILTAPEALKESSASFTIILPDTIIEAIADKESEVSVKEEVCKLNCEFLKRPALASEDDSSKGKVDSTSSITTKLTVVDISFVSENEDDCRFTCELSEFPKNGADEDSKEDEADSVFSK